MDGYPNFSTDTVNVCCHAPNEERIEMQLKLGPKEAFDCRHD